MLNDVLSSHLGGRCTAFSVTTLVTPAITVDLGTDEVSASARAAVGKSTLTLKKPYARLPIVVASPGANIADGGYACYNTASTKSVVTLESLGVAGSGDDGTIHGLSFGHDYAQLEHLGAGNMDQIDNTNGFEPILLAVHLTAAGVATIGSKLVTPVISDTSLQTLTLRHAFARNCFVIASPIGATAKAIRVLTNTKLDCGIQTFQSGGTKEANPFQALILGWRHKDVVFGVRSQIRTPRRKPKLIPFELTNTAGVPSVTIGSDDISVTDNGVGDWTITWKTASKFTQAPVVVVTGATTRAQLAAAPTATSAQILQFNAGGAAADGSIQGIAFGWDIADEYALFG